MLEGRRGFFGAYQLAMIEMGPQMDAIVGKAAIGSMATKRLLKVNLTNYAAAAIMMPYGPFLAAAENLGYDIQVLAARFGASFEQVCHRLTTLSRPTARGVPFFMIRVDQAATSRSASPRRTSLLALWRQLPAVGIARHLQDPRPRLHTDRRDARRRPAISPCRGR